MRRLDYLNAGIIHDIVAKHNLEGGMNYSEDCLSSDSYKVDQDTWFQAFSVILCAESTFGDVRLYCVPILFLSVGPTCRQ